MPEIEKIDASINVSAISAPSQESNKKNIVDTNNYSISIGISLVSLHQKENLRKINNARTKSNIQNMLIQNRQLKNSFYQRYMLYCVKLEQEQDHIIPKISYFPSNLQKVEKTDVLINISRIAILSQDNKRNIIDTNNYPISIVISLISLQDQEDKLRKTNNNRTKSSTQNMSIQNCQLESFYQKHCVNEQKQDQIISYPRNDSQVIYDKPENKIMYIIKWLKNMNETMNVTKVIKPIQSISKQSSVIHDHNQSIHINRNNDNPLQSILNTNTIRARGKREKNLEDYDKVCNFNSIITCFTSFYWLKNLI